MSKFEDKPNSNSDVGDDGAKRSGPNDESFRLLVESVTDYAIFLLSCEGSVETWNAGAEAMNGYQAKEVIGRHFSCFYTSEDVQNGVPARDMETALRVGRCEVEALREHKDGSRFWGNFIITALRVQSGILQGFSIIGRDISER